MSLGESVDRKENDTEPTTENGTDLTKKLCSEYGNLNPFVATIFISTVFAGFHGLGLHVHVEGSATEFHCKARASSVCCGSRESRIRAGPHCDTIHCRIDVAKSHRLRFFYWKEKHYSCRALLRFIFFKKERKQSTSSISYHTNQQKIQSEQQWKTA